MDVDVALPFVDVLFDGRDVRELDGPGIVHEDVNLAVGIERLVDDHLDVVPVRDIGLDPAVVARPGQVTGSPAPRVAVDVGDDDVRTGSRKPLGDAATDSTGGTGDDDSSAAG